MKLRLVLAVLAWFTLIGGAASAAPATCVLNRFGELPVTMVGLRPMVPITINGHEASIVADSGAFFSSLSPASVAKFGLTKGRLPYGLEVRGITGEAEVSMATAKEIVIDKVPHQKVDFLIEDGGYVDQGVGLLGQNLIGVADTEFDLANGVIRLFVAKDCARARFAYWTTTEPYSVIDIVPTSPPAPHVKAWASVNGVKIRVEFDTGTPTSTLTLAAAARAGVKPGGPGVTSGGTMSGFGSDVELQSWIGPFDSFKIGDEEIQHTQLRLSDISLEGDADMLLGADFFLSHRIYVSHDQHKLYFTYNGGPVFNLSAGPAPAAQHPDAALAANAYSDTPTDAAGFARRAAAYAARHDYDHAITDIDHAIAMYPKEARYVFQRAKVEQAQGRSDPERADLDLGLKLKPDDIEGLIARAQDKLADGDREGARQDLDAAAGFAKDDPDMSLRIAMRLEGDKFYKDAVAPLDRWVDGHFKDTERADAMSTRCWYRALWGQELDAALADCEAALKLHPGSPDFLESRGLARLRLGDLELAIADDKAALREAPKRAWALYGRGVAELKLGRKDEGEADIKAATAIDPDVPVTAKAVGLAPSP